MKGKVLLLLAIVLAFSASVFAQRTTVTDVLQLPSSNGKKVSSIMTDTTLTGATDAMLVSARAVKKYVDSRSGGSITQPVIYSVGLGSPLPTQPVPAGSAAIQIIDVNGNKNLHLSNGVSWVSVGELLGVKNVDSLNIAPGEVKLIHIGRNGATTGQVLKWNGTAWAPNADLGTTYTGGVGIGVLGTVISNEGVTSINGETGDLDGILTTSSPLGEEGGDLTGTLGFPSVISIQGQPLSGDTPSAGQVLKWNGTAWAPDDDISGAGGQAPSFFDILPSERMLTQDSSYTFYQLQNQLRDSVLSPTFSYANKAVGLAASGCDTCRTSIVVIGDSNTETGYRMTVPLRKNLQGRFGSGGLGNVSFVGADDVFIGTTQSGTTTQDWVGSHMSLSGYSLLMTSGATYKRNNNATFSGVHSSEYFSRFENALVKTIVLTVWKRSGDGTLTLKVSMPNESITVGTINCNGSGYYRQVFTVPLMYWDIELSTSGGGALVLAIETYSNKGGVVVHNFGNAGTRPDNYTTVDSVLWAQQLQALNPSLVYINSLGTNGSGSEASDSAYIARLIRKIKIACPRADILLSTPQWSETAPESFIRKRDRYYKDVGVRYRIPVLSWIDRLPNYTKMVAGGILEPGGNNHWSIGGGSLIGSIVADFCIKGGVAEKAVVTTAGMSYDDTGVSYLPLSPSTSGRFVVQGKTIAVTSIHLPRVEDYPAFTSFQIIADSVQSKMLLLRNLSGGKVYLNGRRVDNTSSDGLGATNTSVAFAYHNGADWFVTSVNGIFSGSGTTPPSTIVTVTDNITFNAASGSNPLTVSGSGNPILKVLNTSNSVEVAIQAINGTAGGLTSSGNINFSPFNTLAGRFHPDGLYVGTTYTVPQERLHVQGNAKADHFYSVGSGANLMPVGTTAQAPSATQGYFRLNKSTRKITVVRTGNAYEDVLTLQDTIGAIQGQFLKWDGSKWSPANDYEAITMVVASPTTNFTATGIVADGAWRVPSTFNGWVLYGYTVSLYTAGSGAGSITIQVNRATPGGGSSSGCSTTFVAGEVQKDVVNCGLTLSTGDMLRLNVGTNDLATSAQGVVVTYILKP